MYLHKKRHDFLLFIDSWYMINLDARGEHNALTLIHLFFLSLALAQSTHTLVAAAASCVFPMHARNEILLAQFTVRALAERAIKSSHTRCVRTTADISIIARTRTTTWYRVRHDFVPYVPRIARINLNFCITWRSHVKMRFISDWPFREKRLMV